jgi:ribosome-associated heat shock protein Hsp15
MAQQKNGRDSKAAKANANQQDQAAAQACEALRFDKWLFFARFFKTRSLAQEAIEGGRVHIGDEKVKPSRLVKVGDEIHLRKPPYEFHFRVLGLADHRGPAPEAERMYAESVESVAARQALSQQLRDMPEPIFKGRPTKKDRRDLETFFNRREG